MAKVNFVRSRTGILFRISAWSKLQKQLTQAQRALADEQSSHGATEEFLQHQSNARADGEELIEQLRTEVEELKARLAAEESGLGEDEQLNNIFMDLRTGGFWQGMRGEGILLFQLYYINQWLVLAFQRLEM